jgi:polyphosphate kinase
VHAKICLIRKRLNDRIIHYGFVSTGNLNESNAKVYADHCLLTSNKSIMSDVNRMFNYIEHYKTGTHFLKACNTILPSPVFVRRELLRLIRNEIKAAKRGKTALIIAKMNSFADEQLIDELYEAAKEGVEIKLIIRGIYCLLSYQEKFKKPVIAISIIDEYLEHARVWLFHNGGKEKMYISSADWMVRNLDHRVEASCPILDERLKAELKEILEIQLNDNVKARWLDNNLSNDYVKTDVQPLRSQLETYHYLLNKIPVASEISSN